jgi:hypothetical protein
VCPQGLLGVNPTSLMETKKGGKGEQIFKRILYIKLIISFKKEGSSMDKTVLENHSSNL